MAPELFHTMEARELQDLAQKVREYQEAKKLSDNALVKKFSGLGSTKTYKRILNGDLAELDLESQLNNYRAVVALIESISEDDHEDEEYYDDFYAVVQLRRAFFEVARENTIARTIVLQGPTGAGKSSSRKLLLEKYGQRLFWVEASDVWSGSPMALLGAILTALGRKEMPFSQVDRLNMVIKLLSEGRRCCFIEEAHHLGPRGLNTLVSLVNQTPGEFVLLAIDTLWKKLESAAYEECRQLTGNRLAERINLGAEVRENDVRKMLERRIEWENDASPARTDLKQALRLVIENERKLKIRARLAFVRDVINRVNRMANGEPVTIEMFSGAVTAEVESR